MLMFLETCMALGQKRFSDVLSLVILLEKDNGNDKLSKKLEKMKRQKK